MFMGSTLFLASFRTEALANAHSPFAGETIWLLTTANLSALLQGAGILARPKMREACHSPKRILTKHAGTMFQGR